MTWRSTAGASRRRGRTLGAFIASLCILSAAPSGAAAADRIAVQPDGKILVAGAANLGFGMLARLDPDGDLDPSFGDGGIAIDRASTAFTDVAVQPDGGIVALNAWMQLKRFAADGRPDLGFGEAGTAVRAPIALLERPVAIAVLPDGRIALGGNYHVKMRTHQALAFVYAADGGSVEEVGMIGPAQPTYFAGESNPAGSLTALTPWRDETLLMAGFHAPDFNSSGGVRSVLARFVPGAGSPYDPEFGGGAGLVTVPFPDALPTLNALAPAPGGLFATGSVSDHVVLARFSGEGELDAGFGGDGYAEISPGAGLSQGNDLAVQADGKVVVGGERVTKVGRTGRSCRGCRNPLLARFMPDGSLDPSFDGDGVAAVTEADGTPVAAMGETVAELSDGGVLIGGAATSRRPRVLVSRLDRNGQVDRSFGDGGIATIAVCGGSAAAQRSSGCLPSLRARLQVGRHRGGRPTLRLQVGPDLDWVRITHLRLTLPKQLATIPGRGRRIKTTLIEEDGPRRARLALAGRRLEANWTTDPRSVSVVVPPSALRRVEAVPVGRRLPFRIQVRFAPPFFAYTESVMQEVVRWRAIG